MKNLNNFVEQIKNSFDSRIYSVFIYGSKANAESSESDIDLMIILNDLKAKDLEQIALSTRNWIKKDNPTPVFMDKEEWLSSFDTYPIEYLDIKDNCKIIIGADIRETINVKKEDLRIQLESETKDLLMRLRRFYLENSHQSKAIKNNISYIFKNCFAIFKGLLRYKDIQIDSKSEKVISQISSLASLEYDVLYNLLCIKEKQIKMNDKEAKATLQKLIDQIRLLLTYINAM